MIQRNLAFFKINTFVSPFSKVCYTFATAATATKPKAQKTLYQILEIPSKAPQSNIRKNYLKLAKLYHPDVYKGSDKGRFEQVQKAY
jgi:DnaJ-domain-containing protein 1